MMTARSVPLRRTGVGSVGSVGSVFLIARPHVTRPRPRPDPDPDSVTIGRSTPTPTNSPQLLPAPAWDRGVWRCKCESRHQLHSPSSLPCASIDCGRTTVTGRAAATAAGQQARFLSNDGRTQQPGAALGAQSDMVVEAVGS